jgi:hypothetical protein
LIDTKASDSSHLTLLHVLVGIVRKQFPDVMLFTEDLETIPEATRSKFVNLYIYLAFFFSLYIHTNYVISL